MPSRPKFKRVYFVGIKGAMLSGLAAIAKARGFDVAGSDVDETFVTDTLLRRNHIKVFAGFAPENLDWNPDIVVVGASWDKNHPEVNEARKRNIPTMLPSVFLNELAFGKALIAVAGVHGKTTTTSLLAHVFTEAKKSPSYLIGSGKPPHLKSNAVVGRGKFFFVEADEYKAGQESPHSKFLDLSPSEVVLTSIELDHVDFFPHLKSVIATFRKLVKKSSVEMVYANIDDKNVQEAVSSLKHVTTIGTKPDADWYIREIDQGPQKTNFTIVHKKKPYVFTIHLPGEFSVRNASLIIALAVKNGVPIKTVQKALASFRGANRRFQLHKAKGTNFLDDYAHHPTAVRLTLDAARVQFPDKHLICVYQPHQVSRTIRFKDQFAKAFMSCDEVIIPDIFASAREKKSNFTAQDLVQLIQKYHKKARYGGSLKDVARSLGKRSLDAKSMVITMGAGDVYKVQEFYQSNAKEKRP